MNNLGPFASNLVARAFYWTAYALMDSFFQFDTIHLGCSIVYIVGSQVMNVVSQKPDGGF